jgi:hypothetical protein
LGITLADDVLLKAVGPENVLSISSLFLCVVQKEGAHKFDGGYFWDEALDFERLSL